MAEWCEVFSDERVRALVRARARRLVVGFALASGFLVAAAPLVTVWWPPIAGPAALTCGVVLTALAVVTLRRLARLHRMLWRVELSVGRVVAHDVGGRRVSVVWPALDAVDVRHDGIAFAGRDGGGRRVRFVVPRTLPQFTALGHRAVEYAEAFGRPLWVDGQPWDRLDVSDVVRDASAPLA